MYQEFCQCTAWGLLLIRGKKLFAGAAPFTVNIDIEVYQPPACSDGIDNDEDGFIDLNDNGCTFHPTKKKPRRLELSQFVLMERITMEMDKQIIL